MLVLSCQSAGPCTLPMLSRKLQVRLAVPPSPETGVTTRRGCESVAYMKSIEQFVLEQVAAWEVPGCAVAAVHDGQVVLVAGWGQCDLDTKLPVTSDTLFAIGSTTKAFTAATVGALVEDGLLEWERPLRDYVPEIRMNDPVVTERLTVIDLLSHRSGLPRHEMVWLGHPGRSRAEVVRRLRFLPLSKDLRQEFQYCNLGYLAAGYAVEMLSGAPWEDYLRSPAAGPAGNGPVEPVGRRHDRRPGPRHRLRTPPGRRRARAAAAGDGAGAGRRGQLVRRRYGPVAAGPARRRAGRRPGRHVTRHGGAPARTAHRAARGPDLPRVHPARLRTRVAGRPVPGPPAPRTRRRHRRVPDRVHAAARRRHRRGRDDQYVLQRHGAGRRVPCARRAARARAP